MRHSFVRSSSRYLVLSLLSLIIAGCGWEPLDDEKKPPEVTMVANPLAPTQTSVGRSPAVSVPEGSPINFFGDVQEQGDDGIRITTWTFTGPSVPGPNVMICDDTVALDQCAPAAGDLANGNYNANLNGVIWTDNGSFQGTLESCEETTPTNCTQSIVPVTITNADPVADTESYSTNEDTTLNVPAASGVLDGDTDAGASDTLTAVLVSGPTSAAAFTLNPDGSFSYTPNADFNGNDSFTYQAQDDDLGVSAVTTVSIVVNAINDPPVNAVPGPQLVSEDNALSVPAITVADLDVNEGTGIAQVTLTVGNGSLTFGTTAGLTFSDPPGDATTTFTGSLLDLNAALASVSYTPNLDYNGPDLLTVLTDDLGNTGAVGPLTDSDATPIVVSAVNDAPIATDPGAQATPEETSLAFSAAGSNQISVSDVDVAEIGGTNTLQIALTVTNGNLTLATTAGLTFSGGANGTSSMTFSGAPAAVNAALDGLTYAPALNFFGDDYLGVTVDDLGNTGAGGPQADYVEVHIVVTAVNDAPVNAVPGAQTVPEDTDLFFTVGGSNAISVSDVDSTPLFVVLTGSHGNLTLSGTTGLTFASGDGTDDAVMAFSGIPADINAALDGMSFRGALNYNGAGRVRIQVGDGGLAGGTFVRAARVKSNDPSNFWELIVGDTDGEALDLAFGAGSWDDLRYETVNPATLFSSTYSFVLLEGGDANAQELEAFLAANQTLVETWVANGGGLFLNAGPNEGDGMSFGFLGVTLTYPAFSGNCDAAIPSHPIFAGPFTPVAQNYTGSSCAHATVTGGGAVTVVSGNAGPVLTEKPFGSGFVMFGGLTLSGFWSPNPEALNLRANILDYIEDESGVPAVSGLTDDDSVAITITPVNDPPVNGAPTVAQPINEDTPLYFGTGTGNAITVADLDVNETAAPNNTVRVTLTAADGTLRLATLAGLTVTVGDGIDDATMTFIGTLADVNAALLGLRYDPTPEFSGATNISILTDDLGHTGAPGPLTDLDVVPVNVIPTNDLPYPVADAYSVNEDTLLSVAAPGVLANDTDVEGSTLAAMLVSSPSNAGSFALNADGSFTYQGAANFNGSDSFTYAAVDVPLSPFVDEGPTYNAANGHLYYVIRGFGGSYQTAEDIAASLGGHLVTINDVAENTFLTATFSLFDGPYIGLNDRAVEGRYVWIDGQAVGFTNWAGGEPNDAGGVEDFGQIYASGEWNDISPFGSDAAIVEVDHTNVTAVNLTINPVNDEPSFVSGGDVTVAEDSGAYSAAWATSLTAGPADESSQLLDFVVTGNTTPGLFSTAPSVSSSGALSFTPAPNAFGSSDITLHIHDNGGTALGGDDTGADVTFTITVTNVNDAPAVAYSSTPGTVAEGSPFTVSVDITEPAGDPTAGTYYLLTFTWGDASSDTRCIDVNADGLVNLASPSHSYADDTAAPYSISVTARDSENATCTAGTGLTSAPDTDSIDVTNVAPAVSAGADQSSVEGTTVSLAPATFTDAGTGDTHSASIDWGDGSAPSTGTVTQGAGSGSVASTHVYADDGVYTVTVTVTDDDLGSSNDSLQVTIGNVAPVAEAGAGVSGTEGVSASLSGAGFQDQGTADTHVARIAWGDGSPDQYATVGESPSGPPGSTSGATGSAAASHIYAQDGLYPAQLKVIDDDIEWAPETLMPTARYAHAVAATSSTLVVAGGIDGSFSPITSVARYDFVSGMWAPGAPIPPGGGGLAAFAQAGNDLYVAGGNDPAFNPIDAFFRYDIAADAWTPLPPLPIPVYAGGGAVLDGYVYVFGGSDGPNTATPHVQRYDIAGGTWTLLAPMPAARYWASVGVIDGRIIVASGADNSFTAIPSVDLFDPSGPSWSPLAPMPVPALATGNAVVNGVFYVFGGATGAGFPDAGRAYRLDTNQWFSVDSILGGGRAGQRAVALGDSLFLSGGVDNGSVVRPEVETFTQSFSVDTALFSIQNAAPVATAPADFSTDEGSDTYLTMTWTDLGVLDTQECYVDWGDGSPAEGPFACGTGGSGSYMFGPHIYTEDTTDPAGLPYTASVYVYDSDATATFPATDDPSQLDTVDVTVDDVLPVVTYIEADATSSYGESNEYYLYAEFESGAADGPTGGGSDDVVSCSFDFGDGTPVLTIPDGFDDTAGTYCDASDALGNGYASAQALHTYADDDLDEVGRPFGDPADDVYTVTFTVTDEATDDNSFGNDTSAQYVPDIAPAPGPTFVSTNSPHPEGQFTSLVVDWTDVSASDSFRVDIDWNDSSSTQLNLAAGVTNASTSHLYAVDGTYNVTVRVTDDDGLFYEETTIVVVTDVQLVVRSAITNAPVAENAGATVWVDAESANPANLLYSFDWDGNGVFDCVDSDADGIYDSVAPGSSDVCDSPTPYATFTRPDDSESLNNPPAQPGHVGVTVQAKDPGSAACPTCETSLGFVDVRWTNEAPVITSASTAPVSAGTATVVTVVADDASPTDDAAGFTFRFDWNGDGVYLAGDDVTGTSPQTASHTFAAPGSYLVGVRVYDNDGEFSETQVSATVNEVNVAPVAADQTVTTAEDEPVAVMLTATDANGNALTYTVVATPTNGSLTGTAPNLTYVPNTNYVGGDSFTFRANDGTVDSNTATVTITVTPVNDLPVAQDDAYTVVEDTVLNIAALAGVLANDSDVEGALTVTVAATTQHGMLTLNADGSFSYDSNADYSGSDSFTYTATDSDGATRTATVSIEITPANDAPVAAAQTVTTSEDEPVAVVLSAFDEDGEPLTYSVVASATNGSITGTAPNLTYVPNANYVGTDSFTFRANDGTVNSNIATISITVTPVNDLPVADAQQVTTPEDTTLSIVLSGTDVETASASLTYTIVSGPASGSLSGVAPAVDYTPSPDFVGVDSFTFTVTDASGATSPESTVEITVTPVNDAPVASDDYVTTDEDQAVTIDEFINDDDTDGPYPIGISIFAQGANGTAAVGTDGRITYTPNANFNGIDSFEYELDDGTAQATATVYVTVASINDLPVADAQSVSTNEDTAVGITLSGSDVETAAGSLTFSTSSPSHGALSGTAPNLTYTPEAGYHGGDSFTFTVTDADGGVSGSATVSITVDSVDDPPVAANDEVTTDEDQAITFDVLVNDSDVDGDTLTVTGLAAVGNGTATIQNGTTITFTPAANFNGQEIFTYTLSDGTAGDEATGTVTVNVTSINDLPVANAQSVTTSEDTAVAVTLAGSDVEAGALTYTTSSPLHGTLSGTAPSLTYTPDLNYVGGDSFTFTVTDGNGGVSAPATVSIDVTSVDDAPVAVNDEVTTDEDQAVTFDVLVNDSDIDGNTLSVTALAGVGNGTAVIDNGTTITFTPAANFNGVETFTYTLSDGTAGDEATGTVTVNVTSINDLPVANAQSVTTPEDTAVAVTLTGSDVEAGALTYTTSSPLHGTLSGTAPSLTYTPDLNYVGGDSFTFTVTDGNGGVSAPATVSIEVTAANDAPVAVADAATTDEDQAISINVSANDTDVDSAALSVTVGSVSVPSSGTAAIEAGSAGTVIRYTPAANFFGTATFTYTAFDGTASSAASATVTVTVTSVNDLPVANAQNVTVAEDSVGNAITLTGSDVETAAGSLTYTVTSGPAHGVLGGSGANRTYTPAAGYHGEDAFTFTVTDANSGVSSEATVSITVTPVDDAPVAIDDTVTTDEDQAITIQVLVNDSDVDGNALSVTALAGVGNGTAVIDNGTTITFTPAANFFGVETFTYTLSDGTAGDEDTGTVTVNVTSVNDLPVANAQTVTVTEDSVANAINLVASDVETAAGSLTYTITSGPQHGVLSGAGAARTYTPAANYAGDDSFTYRVTDANGGISSDATVAITVTPVGPSILTLADQSGNEGDSITFTATADEASNYTFAFDFQDDGTFDSTVPATGASVSASHVYPDDGTFTVRVRVTDAQGLSIEDTATATIANVAPVLLCGATECGDEDVTEGHIYQVSPSATDAGTADTHTWSMIIDPMPVGGAPEFSSVTGELNWVPTWFDGSRFGTDYDVTLTVTDDDGDFATTTFTLTAFFRDEDNDGMSDTWEIAQGMDPTVDDSLGDVDGDGVVNIDEYNCAFDLPGNNGPCAPFSLTQVSPLTATPAEDSTEDIELTVNETSDPDTAQPLDYIFEVYDGTFTDRGTNLVGSFQTSGAGTPGNALTLTVDDTSITDDGANANDAALSDDTYYWWRARATDGAHPGPWSAYQRVFYNPTNDAPTAPGLTSPLDGAFVSSLTPVLVADNASDADDFLPWGDLTLRFEVYSDAALTTLVTSTNITPQGAFGHTSWVVNQALTENTFYWWTVTAVDPHASETVSATFSFFVSSDNDEPSRPTLVAPLHDAEVNATTATLTVGNAVDPDAQAGQTLSYFFELDSTMTFSSPNYVSSQAITEDASGQTSFTTPTLVENTVYYWRARAADQYSTGEFVMGSFFLNNVNDPPTAPVAQTPGNGTLVDRDDVILTIQNATDPDINDTRTYRFEIWKKWDDADADGIADAGELEGDVVLSTDDFPAGVTEGATTTSFNPGNLKAGKSYWWVSYATDNNGLEGPASVPQKFETLQVSGGGGCSVSGESGTTGTSMLILGLAGMLGVVVIRRKKGPRA